MTNSYSIGVDLGATSFKCGLISPDFRIIARNEAPTYALQGAEQAANRIAENVRALWKQLPEGQAITSLGICSSGPIDPVNGIIIDPPNLGWRNVRFAQMLTDRLGIPVHLEHDAKASALGEFHFGSGRGTHSMALIIVGTGIGAGMIVNGKLYHGEFDSAGEVGHITVDMNGPICTCGSTGCVEAFAGGPAILTAYNYAARRHVESGQEIVNAARNGDEIAMRVFERAGRALGAGIATLAMIMDINTFVLFGSGTKAGDLLRNPVRAAVPRYSYPTVSSRVQVVIGELGNDAGILGAAYGAMELSE